jgi:hypothetical protein
LNPVRRLVPFSVQGVNDNYEGESLNTMHTDNSDKPTKRFSYWRALEVWAFTTSFYAGLFFYACFYAAVFFFSSVAQAGEELGSVDKSGRYQYHGYSSRELGPTVSQDSHRYSLPEA